MMSSNIWILIRDENYDTSLGKLENYVYRNPQNPDGWDLIGFTSRKLEMYENAELYYETGLQIAPNHRGILEYQGELYLQTDRYEKALENLNILDDLCVFNCTEKKQLATAIETYKKDKNL